MNDSTSHLDAFVNTDLGESLTNIETAFHQTTARPSTRENETKVRACKADALEEGKPVIVQHNKRSIGVFRIGEETHAILNRCPHAGAPLCQGHIQTTHAPSDVEEFKPSLQGRVIRCPWHGWEFDIPSGQGLHDCKSRVRTFPTSVDEEGWVLIHL